MRISWPGSTTAKQMPGKHAMIHVLSGPLHMSVLRPLQSRPRPLSAPPTSSLPPLAQTIILTIVFLSLFLFFFLFLLFGPTLATALMELSAARSPCEQNSNRGRFGCFFSSLNTLHPPERLKKIIFSDRWKRTHDAQNAHMPTLYLPPPFPSEGDLNQFDCGGGLWRRGRGEERKGTETFSAKGMGVKHRHSESGSQPLLIPLSSSLSSLSAISLPEATGDPSSRPNLILIRRPLTDLTSHCQHDSNFLFFIFHHATLKQADHFDPLFVASLTNCLNHSTPVLLFNLKYED